MTTTRVEPSKCPFCATELDAVTGVTTEDSPEPGDFTVCIGCCKVLRFADDMTLLPSSLLDIPMHSRLQFAKVVQACGEVRRSRQ